MAATALCLLGLRAGRQAGAALRSRRQVRQVVQRGRFQRRREVQDRDRASSMSSSKSPTTRSASRRCAASPRTAATRSSWPASPGRRRWTRSPPTSRTLKFAIIDMVVDKPNVRSIVFKEQEGSYLVGVLAGMASQDQEGRLRRRHGHPAHPQVRLRLCRRRQGGRRDARSSRT